MKVSQIKKQLTRLNKITFQLPNGDLVPSHFHITEIGKITKRFIDCGGILRNEEVVNFQLWTTNYYDHRLHPEKLLAIIELSEDLLGIDDLEVEVEFQGDTIQKFGLDFDGYQLLLTTKQTDCLAKDQCGIPIENLKNEVYNIQASTSCSPVSGCC